MHTIPPARVCSTPIKTPATARPIRADAHRTDPGIEEEDPSVPRLVRFSSCDLTAASRSRACSRSRSLSSHCRIGGATPGSTSVAEEVSSTDVCKLRTASRIFSSFCAERDRSCCAYRTSCSTNATRRDQERISSSISPPVGTARIRSWSHSTQSVCCFCFAVSVERRAALSTSMCRAREALRASADFLSCRKPSSCRESSSSMTFWRCERSTAAHRGSTACSSASNCVRASLTAAAALCSLVWASPHVICQSLMRVASSTESPRRRTCSSVNPSPHCLSKAVLVRSAPSSSASNRSVSTGKSA